MTRLSSDPSMYRSIGTATLACATGVFACLVSLQAQLPPRAPARARRYTHHARRRPAVGQSRAANAPRRGDFRQRQGSERAADSKRADDTARVPVSEWTESLAANRDTILGEHGRSRDVPV